MNSKLNFLALGEFDDQMITEPVTNIFLGNKSNDKDLLKDTTPQEAYIIHQNDVLHSENRQATERVIELEHKCEELESECGSAEKSLAHTKGMLKNLVETNNLCLEKATLYEQLRSIERTHLNRDDKTYRNRCRYTALAALALQAGAFAVFDVGPHTIYTCSSLCFILTAMMRPPVNPPDVKCILDGIAKLKKDIDELAKSNDFLSEYIDCI